MFYRIVLYTALAVFGMGLIYKISAWFRFRIGFHAGEFTPSARTAAAVKGIFAVLFSDRFSVLTRVFFTDVLFQLHVLKQDVLRWRMHMLIYAGFTFLLFTHVLDKIIPLTIFDRFYLALNPFLLASGLMVFSGVAIAVYRRFFKKVTHFKTNAMDRYALMILAVIMLSGIALESTKLTSYNHFQKIWYVHILSCFIGLAYLPFSKMFHIFTTPLSLLANAVMGPHSDPANIMTRRVMALDACMHCGTCSNRCSVAVAYDSIGNDQILPSERIASLKAYIVRKRINARDLAAIQQGIYLCTNCDRCTVACPAGIDLRDLWFCAREELIQRGHSVSLMLTPFSVYRGLNREILDAEHYEKPLKKAEEAVSAPYGLLKETEKIVPFTPANREFKRTAGLSVPEGITYAHCFTCENCSTVCPVAGNYENPQEALDLLPHQIIRAMGFGLKDLAMGSKMLWYCLTCYQCQEHCPQGVKVADIFYELKNLAVKEASRSEGIRP